MFGAGGLAGMLGGLKAGGAGKPGGNAAPAFDMAAVLKAKRAHIANDDGDESDGDWD
jgi:hypothetical protein